MVSPSADQTGETSNSPRLTCSEVARAWSKAQILCSSAELAHETAIFEPSGESWKVSYGLGSNGSGSMSPSRSSHANLVTLELGPEAYATVPSCATE